jgi:hypothetical protein
MKQFSSILVLLLLMLGGPGWGKCSKNVDCSRSKLSWETVSRVQPVVLQGTFLDDQDTNDIDGPEFYVINPTPTVNPLQYRANTVTIVLPFTFQVHMNKLLIDLPPPSFS